MRIRDLQELPQLRDGLSYLYLEHETRGRQACRDVFRQKQLLARILPDMDQMLSVSTSVDEDSYIADNDPAWPAPLWSAPDTALMEASTPWSS